MTGVASEHHIYRRPGTFGGTTPHTANQSHYYQFDETKPLTAGGFGENNFLI